MRWLLFVLLLQRGYWVISLDSLAVGRPKHTHVAVTGTVVYTQHETDGDTHIKLASPSGRFIIAECIPKLPCLSPTKGSRITVKGISRPDPEHGWWEVHPVEEWFYAK